MHKNSIMRHILLTIAAAAVLTLQAAVSAAGQSPDYDTYFTTDRLRVDFILAGNAQTQHVSPHDKPFDRITQHLNREIKIDIRLKEALLDPLQQRESELSEAVSATMFRRNPFIDFRIKTLQVGLHSMVDLRKVHHLAEDAQH